MEEIQLTGVTNFENLPKIEFDEEPKKVKLLRRFIKREYVVCHFEYEGKKYYRSFGSTSPIYTFIVNTLKEGDIFGIALAPIGGGRRMFKAYR